MKLLIILLQVAFIVLKLTNVIQWHWLWVLSPMIAVNLFLLLVFAGAIYSVNIEAKQEKKRMERYWNKPKHESKFQQRMNEMMRKAKNNS